MKPHHVLDIYGVHLYLASTKGEWKKLSKQLSFIDTEKPESAGLAHFAVWEPKGPGICIPHLVLWIDKAEHTSPSELIETCSHEASYGAAQILAWTGHDLRGTHGVDEPTAYLTGWLTSWIYDRVTDTAA